MAWGKCKCKNVAQATTCTVTWNNSYLTSDKAASKAALLGFVPLMGAAWAGVEAKINGGDAGSGGSVCTKNVFLGAAASIQTFPSKPDGVTKEFLSGAIGTEVTGFESRVCAEGQVAMTVVCYNIQYADAHAHAAGKPRGVALKISHTDGREQLFAPLYEREMHVYSGWGDSVAAKAGINIPTALGIWKVIPEEGALCTFSRGFPSFLSLSLFFRA